MHSATSQSQLLHNLIKVKTVTPFISKVDGVYFKEGSTLEVSEERAKELEGYVIIIDKPSSTKVDDDKPKATKKKATTKKK